jgi:hypothetical protein
VSYITTSDITDGLLLTTALSALLTAKITECDAALNDLAIRKGVFPTDIPLILKTNPLPHTVKRWAVAWTCKELCFDLIGKNKNDNMDWDVYLVKYKEFQKRCSEFESEINYEILTGFDFEMRQRPGPRTGTMTFGG